MAESAIWRTKFEVFGKVQGVFFRKYTQSKANDLGIRGYVRNTTNGSVEGVIEGNEVKFKEMKKWLSKIGSPKSVIQGAVWKGEKTIPQFTYSDFSIKRD